MRWTRSSTPSRTASARRERRQGWCVEHRSGVHLRWYEGGRPTGHVTIFDWDPDHDGHPVFALDGYGVRLIWRPGRIIISQHRDIGRRGTRVELPMASCVAAHLRSARDRDGSRMLRLELEVRICSLTESVLIPLCFPLSCERDLRTLANAITPKPVIRRILPLSRISVARVPDTEEWLSFRPLAGSSEVLTEEEIER